MIRYIKQKKLSIHNKYIGIYRKKITKLTMNTECTAQ